MVPVTACPVHSTLELHRIGDESGLASGRRRAVIARVNGFSNIVVVSDGTHLFRIHAICEHDGLTVYTSPRPAGRSIPREQRAKRLMHEIVSYTAWKLKLH